MMTFASSGSQVNIGCSLRSHNFTTLQEFYYSFRKELSTYETQYKLVNLCDAHS